MSTSPGAADAPFDPAAFASQFQTFLEAVTQLADAPVREAFHTLLSAHLGTGARSLEPVRQQFASWRWVDLDAALTELFPTQDVRGVVGAEDISGISDLLGNRFGTCALGAVERRALPAGPGEVRHVVTNGLRLLHVDDEPVVVFSLETESHPMEQPAVFVEVLAADPGRSRAVLALISERVRESSVLSGQIVSFTASEYESEGLHIDFHQRPEVSREDLVLPHGALERIEASVLGMSDNAASLRAAGQHLSRGVLLYGPPGTGKTHTVRYLLSQARSTAAILLQGEALGRVRQAAQAARELGRAIVVLEDADLVAADREFSEGSRPILFDVLDVLDGLDEDADIAFVLTTNRVEVLEEALALRPGRIDLAVEVPLPAYELRVQLFSRYARFLPVTQAGLEAAAAASEGATGSFAKEAVRRAVLGSLTDGGEVGDAQLLSAVESLMAEGVVLREAMHREEADADAVTDADAFEAHGFDGGEAPEDECPGR